MKILFSLFISLLSTICISQKLVSITKTIILEKKYSITEAYFRESLPIDIKHKQSIIEINLNPKADAIYFDSGVMHAKWNISDFEEGDSIKVNIVMAINKYDLETTIKNPSTVQTAIDLDQYLKDAKNLNIENNKIRDTAMGLKGDDDYETVNNVFNFVTNHMQYNSFKQQNRSAKKALKQGKGDCTEYSELMISLCRANGIPAKIVTGYTLNNNEIVENHNWVEVYLAKNGWTPFDPTFADAENTNTTFLNMNNVYVYLSNSRNHIIDFYEYKYNSKHYKFDVVVDTHWKDITRIKHFELIKLYNEYDHQKTKKLLDTLLISAPNKNQYIMFQAITQARLKNFNEAQSLLQSAWTNTNNNLEKASVLYAFTNYYALKGDIESALSHLEKAIELGFTNSSHILQDRDLESLRGIPRFKEIVTKIKNE